MQQTNDHSSAQSQLTSALGNTAPLISGRRAPDKRRISLRWLFGTVLTGVTSLGLMGGALYAALDGRQQLARPASILDKLTARAGGGRATNRANRARGRGAAAAGAAPTDDGRPAKYKPKKKKKKRKK